MRLLTPVFSLLLLGGCTFGSVQELKSLNPQANDFGSSLAAEYLAYAESESEQGHSLSAGHFAGKGMNAFKGKRVAPESPGQDSGLASAHATLLALLTDDAKHIIPQTAARAQLLYDCWTVQAARKEGEQSVCADEFQATLPDLQKVVTSLALGKEEAHLIVFPPKSTRLSDEAMGIMAEVGRYTGMLKNYNVVLEGYTGNAASRRLLGKRAHAIRNVLSGLEVDPSRVLLINGKNSKEVYLSCNDSITDPDTVRITLRIIGNSEPTTKQESGL